MPKLAKASDGKLEGLTFPGLAASCPGSSICPVKADEIRKMGKIMKKFKKATALLLAVSLVAMSGVMAFADVEGSAPASADNGIVSGVEQDGGSDGAGGASDAPAAMSTGGSQSSPDDADNAGDLTTPDTPADTNDGNNGDQQGAANGETGDGDAPSANTAGFSEADPLTVPEEGLEIENGTLKGIADAWIQETNPDGETMYAAICVPKSVTAIGTNALRDKTSVKIVSLDFSQAENLVSIGNQAALHNASLRGVVDLSATQVERIGKLAFSDCPNLTGVILPAGLKELGEKSAATGSVFTDCKGLQFIRTAGGSADAVFELPDGLTYIGKQTFKNCFAAGIDAKVKLPASVETVGSEAFYDKQISQIVVGRTSNSSWDNHFAGYSDSAFSKGDANPLVIFQGRGSYIDYTWNHTDRSNLTYTFNVRFNGVKDVYLQILEDKLFRQPLRYTKGEDGFWYQDENFTLPEPEVNPTAKPGYDGYWVFKNKSGIEEKVTADYRIDWDSTPSIKVGYALQNPTIAYTVNGAVQESRDLSVELVDNTSGTVGVKVSHPLLKSESGTEENYVFFRYAWWDEVTVKNEDNTITCTINGPRSEEEPELFSHSENGSFVRTLTDKAEISITGKEHARKDSDQYLVEVYGYIVENGGEPRLFYKSHHNTIDFGSDHDTEATVQDVYTMHVDVTNAFSVVFHGNGGKWEADQSESRTIKVPEGEYVTMPEAPVRSGYTFTGWRCGEELYQPGDTLEVSDKMELTAQWKKKYVPPVDPTDPVGPEDPVDPQPLPPDDPLEEPDDAQEKPDDQKQPLPEDEHLVNAPDAEKAADPDQPKTGDEAPLMGLTAVLLVSAGALGAICVRRRKTDK